ncbi:MAG TPA: T9SS type A sorting domain-containing protein, partial [Bacteroidia bacterium]
MLRTRIIIGIVLLKSFTILAQTPVGHTTITFNDPARTGGYGSGGGPGRQIQTEVYYPAASTGNDVAVAGTGLPVIVFGHGFSMAWDAYANVWESLVNEGYVIAFPRTEGNLSPSHLEFGTDLAQVVTKMQALNTNTSSLFFGKLGTTSAIMGHSMGGGSSFLAGTINTSVTTMVTFAAANTNPSSITAAQQITIPNLVISGVNDCVAPPADHQDDMYDSLIANYKTQVNIIGGGHCYFANTNFNCSFGEGTCSPNPGITRTQQQSATMDFTALWLRKFLKNDCDAGNAFQDSLNTSTRITFRQNNPIGCSSVGVYQHNGSEQLIAYPNPAAEFISFKGIAEIFDLEIRDLTGRIVLKKERTNPSENINIQCLEKGIYLVEVFPGNNTLRTTIVKR